MLVGQNQYWWVLSFSLITDRSRSLCHNYFICLSHKASNDQILIFFETHLLSICLFQQYHVYQFPQLFFYNIELLCITVSFEIRPDNDPV